MTDWKAFAKWQVFMNWLDFKALGRLLDKRGVPHVSGSVGEGNSASASAPAVTRETRAGARYRGHTESWQTGHPDARAYTITEHSTDSLTLTHTHKVVPSWKWEGMWRGCLPFTESDRRFALWTGTGKQDQNWEQNWVQKWYKTFSPLLLLNNHSDHRSHVHLNNVQ